MNIFDLFGREYGSTSSSNFNRGRTKTLFEFADIKPVHETLFDRTINGLDFDCTSKFLLTCSNDGIIQLKEILDESSGLVKNVHEKDYYAGFANRSQWYPCDNGMFNVTYRNRVLLIDTNTLKVCETHKFWSNVNWSDWNPINTHLIAVGTSTSSVRFIDIRSGSDLHLLTIASPLGNTNNSATRVLWDPLDGECVYVGDSSGYIHIYDIRSPRRSIQLVASDQALCEPVTCLQSTNDQMNLITCHGTKLTMNMWTFKNRQLVNTHVNFHHPVKKRLSGVSDASFIKCQLHVTDDHVFSPAGDGRGDEILVNDLRNGSQVARLSSEAWRPSNARQVTAVAGIAANSTLLFTGGRRSFKVWAPRLCDKDAPQHPTHKDDWSDGE